MADVGSAGALTRSQIEGCEAAHLESAATGWTADAGEWESQFATLHKGTLSPGGTPWEGTAADAAQDGTFADLVKVRGMADHLHAAAAAARNGADDIAWAERQALDAISEAESAGFTVGEDLSVSDRSVTPLLSEAWAARHAQAEAFASDIRVAAENLVAVDKSVAGKITAAIAPLGETTFDGAPGEPVVQAVDYKTAPPPTDPDEKPNPKDPHETDPNRSRDGTYGPGNSGDGKAAEEAALDDREERTHIPIDRQQVRATHPDVTDPDTGKPQGRYYDGLEPTGNPDEYIGVEAKSNPGARRPDQERFDNAVSPDRPATATLNGRPIKIIDAQTIYPPEGWVPPSAQNPVTTQPPASGQPGVGASGGAQGQGTAPVGGGLAEASGQGSAPAATSALPGWGTTPSPEELLRSDDPVLRIAGQLLLDQQRQEGVIDPDNIA